MGENVSHVLLGLIVSLAFVVEGAAGFGSTLVAVTLGAMLFDIEYVLAVFVPVNIVLSAYLVLRHWAFVDGQLLSTRILPVMLGGMAVGFFLTQGAQQAWFKPAFGTFVCVLAAGQLWSGLRAERELAPQAPMTSWSSGAWLLAGGLVHGVFASGGPLVVYFVSRVIPDKGRFRATLSALWLLTNCLFIGRYAWEGKLTLGRAWVSAGLLGSLIIGIVGGEWLHHKLDARKFRLFVASVLLLAGLGLLWASWNR